ncbi:unnamed protein product [Protopolystoma xenopodis]|uniref:Uncharacterized protein n=1 Tax=Protopolystoma xenopodis TaxID=117903 RepID=A0A3S5FCX4_9PLAT|nr:unnamed protein product [Protopolystoma xenopodis]
MVNKSLFESPPITSSNSVDEHAGDIEVDYALSGSNALTKTAIAEFYGSTQNGKTESSGPMLLSESTYLPGIRVSDARLNRTIQETSNPPEPGNGYSSSTPATMAAACTIRRRSGSANQGMQRLADTSEEALADKDSSAGLGIGRLRRRQRSIQQRTNSGSGGSGVSYRRSRTLERCILPSSLTDIRPNGSKSSSIVRQTQRERKREEGRNQRSVDVKKMSEVTEKLYRGQPIQKQMTKPVLAKWRQNRPQKESIQLVPQSHMTSKTGGNGSPFEVSYVQTFIYLSIYSDICF